MSAPLKDFTTIGSSLAVRLQIDKYSTTSGGPYTQQVLRFSDSQQAISITETGGTFVYKGVGNFLNISPTRSELKTSTNEITLSLSGIPNSSIAEIHNSKIKGSRIEVWRVIYNVNSIRGNNNYFIPINLNTGNSTVSGINNNSGFNGTYIANDGLIGRFFGVVTNYSLDETYDNKESSNTINLTCSTWMDILSSKVVGRKTNPVDQRLWYPGDASMDRVPNLTGANYNFGQYTG